MRKSARIAFVKNVFNSLFVTVVLCSLNSFAQEENKQNRAIWGMLGAGVNTVGGPGANASISIKSDANLFTIKTDIAEQFEMFGDNPPNRVSEIILMYGITGGKDRIIGSFSVGAGIVHGVRRGNLIGNSFLSRNFERIEYTSFGFGFDGQFIVKPRHNGLGFGIDVFANINQYRPYLGSSICLIFYFE